MRMKVELHDDVYVYLRHYCTPDEVQDFTAQLQVIRDDPVKKSELHIDPAVGPFALRRFRFGAGESKIAVFEIDVAEPRIKVIECRLFKQHREKRSEKGKHPGGESAT